MGKRKLVTRRGFTLVELLVAMGIIAILFGMGIRSYSSLMRRIKDASSQTDLAAVKVALDMHAKDEGDFPSDGQDSDLYKALAKYEVGKSIFTNPYNGKSYENLYVKRNANSEKEESFIIASPSVKRKETMVLLSGREPQKLPLREVTYNGTLVEPGDKVTGGTLDFGDGTTVTADPGTEVMLIQSFELPEGSPYGLVRVEDKGKVNVEVNPSSGWRFEVITPAAIAGVAGTKFSVDVRDREKTRIAVTEGKVRVMERVTGAAIILKAGNSADVEINHRPRIRRGHHDSSDGDQE